MESQKENNIPEFKSFTPKEGIVAPEHVQIIEEHLRELMRERDRLVQELPKIDPKDTKRFEDLRSQIIVMNDAIQRNAIAIGELMEGVEQETRMRLERGINPKKSKMN
ncbi:hypothetical protein KGQ34_02745 [Patescibacteria group bacterium]|nr:hypothetical protein [Patescibacteria group bacterium]